MRFEEIVFATACVHRKSKEKCSQMWILATPHAGFRLVCSPVVSCKFGNFKEGESSYWKHRNMKTLWQMSLQCGKVAGLPQLGSAQPAQPSLGTLLAGIVVERAFTRSTW